MGERARLGYNLAALRLLRALQDQQRPATAQEQSVLARWTSWGALPSVFDPQVPAMDSARAELAQLLSPAEFDAARRTTINAHYTNVAYGRAMWAALESLGFSGGRVLEPGCGAGGFIGAAPVLDNLAITGVELDPVSAAIAEHLYPAATIRTESFADTPSRPGTFDAVIGNVPFGQVVLHDRVHNPGRESIHNHFIIKGLDLLKPGGTMAVLTSRFTLDSQSESARQAMFAQADLLGAIRLPTGAHKEVAGTEVVTDLLLFRRRLPGEVPSVADPVWLHTKPWAPVSGDSTESVHLNNYFRAFPEHVLGEMSLGHGMYSASTLQVNGPGRVEDVSAALSAQISDIVQRARAGGLQHSAPISSAAAAVTTASPSATSRFEGALSVGDDGGLLVYRDGEVEPLEAPASQHAELRALIGLRDASTTLLEAEAATVGDSSEEMAGLERLRSVLNTRYEAYRDRYGPVNRFTLARTGRVDENGEDVMRRMVPGAIRTFRSDPFLPQVLALENFDPATQVATKAAMFSRRVVAPRTARTSADSPADALAISLDTTGRVDLPLITSLLAEQANVVDEVDAMAALGDLVYVDPARDEVVTAAEYLSGNVRTKLAIVKAAVEDGNEQLQRNVTALEQIQPVDLLPEEIQVALGAIWIPASDVQAFLRDTLDDKGIVVRHLGGSNWQIDGVNRHSVEARSTWGTTRMDAGTLALRMMKQQRIVVNDVVVDADGRETRVINPVETDAAGEKAAALAEEFTSWVWSDPDRSRRLAADYNEKFNATVLRTYDTEHLTLPGLTLSFTPRPHQLAAVARMMAEPSVGLYHEVGAGKTAEMVIGVSELKRLGLVRKPAIVVPNHMLEQFGREYLQLYPQAQILVASSEDLVAAKRRQFVARIATGDWDAVIMTRTAFEALPVSRDAEEGYLREEMGALRAQLKRARTDGAKPGSIRRMETQVANAEERLKAKLDRRRDVGVTFEQTGIDYLCVDELHDYKNLTVVSSIEGVAKTGSQRATDLDMKIWLLRDRHGERVITGATATPIANSVSEMYVMQRYIDPDALTRAGLTDFDSWAATFGKTVTEVEMAPEGGGRYRTTTRFASFRNVPELLRMWHGSADVKTAEDLNLPTPALWAREDGQRSPQSVVIAPRADVEAYVEQLGERAGMVRARQVEPRVDNMLKISLDGRKAALDMRLVAPDTADESLLTDMPSKLDVAASRIHRIWSEHQDRVYLGADGQPHRAHGAVQIVFCDLGTPSEGWNVYDQLRENLAGHGMDPARIRFIHDAAKDSQKAELFAACRDGGVDVIIGSTAKMGVGTNIQDRAIALHHLDAPWRPADIAQREGRILRQGNQNDEIGIYRYVVERSFDAYMWQTLERKAKFIAQIMRGRLDVREIDDIGNNALSFNEVKALASGDPRILQRAEAEQALVRLQRLERAWQRNQSTLQTTIRSTENEIRALREQRIPALEAAIARRVETRGDAFSAVVGGTTFTDRARAAGHARRLINAHASGLSATTPERRVPALISVGGHDLDLNVRRTLGTVAINLQSPDPGHLVGLTVTSEDLTADGHGLITRIENRVAGLDQRLADTHDAITAGEEVIAKAHAQLGGEFPHKEDLAGAITALASIEADMAHQSGPARTPLQPRPDLPSLSPARERDLRYGRRPVDHRSGTTPRLT